MNNLKFLFNASAVVGLCALSGQGWAWCEFYGPSTTANVEVAIGTITVPSNATVGTLLKTVTVPDSAMVQILCPYSHYLWSRFQYGDGTGRTVITGPGIPAGVVSTGVEGIGVRVGPGFPISVGPGIAAPYATLPDVAGALAFNNGAYQPSDWYGMWKVKIEFYKTGNITPGAFSFPKNFVEAWMSPYTGSTYEGVLIGTLNISGTTDIKMPGCVTPSLTVPLGKHAKSDFSGVGSTSAPTPFTFAINNCDAGLTAVKYTFKPATGITLEDRGLATQHLTVKSGPGTASGIGVQVLYNNDTLVPFGSAISTTAGSHTIAMKARYIQTASAISAGDANSALEFTMTYQ